MNVKINDNQNGKSITTKKSFSRTTRISENIAADSTIVWDLLTNSMGYPHWNSTVLSIDGEIRLGQKIKLKSSLAPDKAFKLKIKEFEPHYRLVWGDMIGRRTFTMERNNGGTLFSMTERLGSLLFPLFSSKIPSFDESFEKFTRDLKNEAENIANQNNISDEL